MSITKSRSCSLYKRILSFTIRILFTPFGQQRACNELKKKSTFISPGGVRSVWLRHGLETFAKHLKALEVKVSEQGLILTDAQVATLEKAKEEKTAQGEIETHHPGYLGAQDTYYVGYIKGVGKIYQQTFIDTYTKVAQAKVYDRKNALVAADKLNDKVLPFYEQHKIPLLRTIIHFIGLKRSLFNSLLTPLTILQNCFPKIGNFKSIMLFID